MFVDVGVAQCELFAAQFDDEMSLFEIFELVPSSDGLLGGFAFGFAKAFYKSFARWFFAAAVLKFIVMKL